ncbi:MAG: exodeoxyribonuclease VII small subunit [Armatimonadetes bacterium]|nr:exodeoxyribonuclease VII small subunit [Armatimonadota bacterium]
MMEEAVRELSFEAAVERLEGIVSAMEAGNLPLDECLRQFEEAVALSRRCAAQLDQAEQRIQVLTADGQLQVSPTPPWES